MYSGLDTAPILRQRCPRSPISTGAVPSSIQMMKVGVAFLYPDASFPPCTYKVSPAKRSVSGLAGTGSIGVSTRPECGWTAVSTVPWIIITEGDRGSGKDEVVYTVIANTARTARRGSLLIAGKTVKIKQKGVKQPKTRVPPFSPG